MDRTRIVLAVINKTGFKLNPMKAQLVNQNVRDLGLNLGLDGRSSDLQSMDLIGKLPAPVT